MPGCSAGRKISVGSVTVIWSVLRHSRSEERLIAPHRTPALAPIQEDAPRFRAVSGWSWGEAAWPLCQMARPFGRVGCASQVFYFWFLTPIQRGDFAKLPGPQAATRLYSSKVTDRRSLQPFTFEPVTLGPCQRPPAEKRPSPRRKHACPTTGKLAPKTRGSHSCDGTGNGPAPRFSPAPTD
jgi:hypothetical protein